MSPLAAALLFIACYHTKVVCQEPSEPTVAGHNFLAYQSGPNVTLSVARVIPSGTTLYTDIVFPDVQFPAQGCGDRFARCKVTLVCDSPLTCDSTSTTVVALLPFDQGAGLALFDLSNTNNLFVEQHLISIPDNAACNLTDFVVGSEIYGLCYEFVDDLQAIVSVYRVIVNFNQLIQSAIFDIITRNPLNQLFVSNVIFGGDCGGFPTVSWFANGFATFLVAIDRSSSVVDVFDAAQKDPQTSQCFGNSTHQVVLFEGSLLGYCNNNITVEINVCSASGDPIVNQTTLFYCSGNRNVYLEVRSDSLSVTSSINFTVPSQLDPAVPYRGDCVDIDDRLFFIASLDTGAILLVDLPNNSTSVLATNAPVDHKVFDNRFVQYQDSISSMILDLSCSDPAIPIHESSMPHNLSSFLPNAAFSCIQSLNVSSTTTITSTEQPTISHTTITIASTAAPRPTPISTLPLSTQTSDSTSSRTIQPEIEPPQTSSATVLATVLPTQNSTPSSLGAGPIVGIVIAVFIVVVVALVVCIACCVIVVRNKKRPRRYDVCAAPNLGNIELNEANPMQPLEQSTEDETARLFASQPPRLPSTNESSNGATDPSGETSQGEDETVPIHPHVTSSAADEDHILEPSTDMSLAVEKQAIQQSISPHLRDPTFSPTTGDPPMPLPAGTDTPPAANPDNPTDQGDVCFFASPAPQPQTGMNNNESSTVGGGPSVPPSGAMYAPQSFTNPMAHESSPPLNDDDIGSGQEQEDETDGVPARADSNTPNSVQVSHQESTPPILPVPIPRQPNTPRYKDLAREPNNNESYVEGNGAREHEDGTIGSSPACFNGNTQEAIPVRNRHSSNVIVVPKEALKLPTKNHEPSQWMSRYGASELSQQEETTPRLPSTHSSLTTEPSNDNLGPQHDNHPASQTAAHTPPYLSYPEVIMTPVEESSDRQNETTTAADGRDPLLVPRTINPIEYERHRDQERDAYIAEKLQGAECDIQPDSPIRHDTVGGDLSTDDTPLSLGSQGTPSFGSEPINEVPDNDRSANAPSARSSARNIVHDLSVADDDTLSPRTTQNVSEEQAPSELIQPSRCNNSQEGEGVLSLGSESNNEVTGNDHSANAQSTSTSPEYIMTELPMLKDADDGVLPQTTSNNSEEHASSEQTTTQDPPPNSTQSANTGTPTVTHGPCGETSLENSVQDEDLPIVDNAHMDSDSSQSQSEDVESEDLI